MRNALKLFHLAVVLLTIALPGGMLNASAQNIKGQEKSVQPATKQTASISSLIQALKSKDENERSNANSELIRIGPPAIPALVEFLNHEKGEAQVEAAEALAQIDPKNPLPRQTLIEVINQSDGETLVEAAAALGEIDSENGAAVPALVKLASRTFFWPSQKNVMLYQSAAHVLGMSEPGVKALTQLLRHEDSWVRRRAVFAFDDRTETLGDASPAIQSAVKDAIPALIANISDKDEVVRCMAAEDLGQIGDDAIPFLMKATKSEDQKLARAATELLQQIQNRGRGVKVTLSPLPDAN
jgi:HEAT repeat protein